MDDIAVKIVLLIKCYNNAETDEGMISVAKFDKIYKLSFYFFITVYVLELLLASGLYFYLPDVVPVHIGLNSVDLWGKGKYIIFLLPCFLILLSFISKPEYAERRYLPGTYTTTLIKLFLLVVQIICLLGSINYFYILLKIVLEGANFFH